VTVTHTEPNPKAMTLGGLGSKKRARTVTPSSAVASVLR
jgi:hypothetical protein